MKHENEKKRFRGEIPPPHIPNFLGVIGESLIDRPFYWLLENHDESEDLKAIVKNLSTLMGQTEERLLILDSALILEEKIDKIMSSIFPDFKKLAENRDFTFSLKTDLLSSLCLIPKKIVQGVHIVRKLRNKVAHDIDCDVKQIIKKDRQSIESHLKKFYSSTEQIPKDEKELFLQLVYDTNLALIMYGKSVERVFIFLRETDLSEMLHHLDTNKE